MTKFTTDVIKFAFNDLYNSCHGKKQPENPHVQRQDWSGYVVNGNIANTACPEFSSPVSVARVVGAVVAQMPSNGSFRISETG